MFSNGLLGLFDGFLWYVSKGVAKVVVLVLSWVFLRFVNGFLRFCRSFSLGTLLESDVVYSMSLLFQEGVPQECWQDMQE